MSDPTYCYPPRYRVLRNNFKIRNQKALDAVEREFVTERMCEPLPQGHFDLAHLRAIHHHLFQDLYEWAGDIRTVEISKNGSQFQACRLIVEEMSDINRRLAKHDYLKGLDGATFALKAGEILGDVNFVHPFREGNGRSQILYLKQLAEQAGHPINLTLIEKEAWMTGSQESHHRDYSRLVRCIAIAIGLDQDSQEAG